ncbi:MAG: hypothetical protein MJZ84_05020 [Paludibacteraceae bacterium]|nr:hypothetical protein [Paludibacteraceae bacterium]
MAQAKQVTITPVRGSAWFLSVEQLGHLSIQGDSLIVYSNDGFEYGREALTDVRRIAVEESASTSTPTLRTRRAKVQTKGTKVLEPNGQIVILHGKRQYGIEGMRK